MDYTINKQTGATISQLNKLAIIFLVFLSITSYVDASVAELNPVITAIDYDLGGGWVYEEDYSNTLELSPAAGGGVTAEISVQDGIDDGGLTASRHGLPGFQWTNHSFLELQYTSLTTTVNGENAYADLNLELEFTDSSMNEYQVATNISQYQDSVYFETWFEISTGFSSYVKMAIDDQITLDNGALGLYILDGIMHPYFKEIDEVHFLPFIGWDISQIISPQDFVVDNDFEAYTLDGGSVFGSVNLDRIVYGVASSIPEPSSLLIFLSGLIAFCLYRKNTTYI